MSIDAHLDSLQKKHATLEREIGDAMTRPGVDDLDIAKLKREKLRIKDEIERLRSETRH